MAFRASNIVPAQGLNVGKGVAMKLRNYCITRRQQFQGGGSADTVLMTRLDLRNFRSQLDDVRQTPGIAAYAQAQENDGTYDVVAEFNALLATIDAAITEIESTFPTESNGYVLEKQFDPSGYTIRTFNNAQLSGLRNALQSIVDAVS